MTYFGDLSMLSVEPLLTRVTGRLLEVCARVEDLKKQFRDTHKRWYQFWKPVYLRVYEKLDRGHGVST